METRPARRPAVCASACEGATRQGWDARFLLADFTSAEITLCRPAVSLSAVRAQLDKAGMPASYCRILPVWRLPCAGPLFLHRPVGAQLDRAGMLASAYPFPSPHIQSFRSRGGSDTNVGAQLRVIIFHSCRRSA